ncbi:acyl carrier protein [Tistlia consotensis]|uniref:Acyl carrier protein n=1 Tax=Tistlia consotensis USBA 355 TaxID=560819 RepID=A0A1Y6CQ27_9PROT|nr:acyl carrier protein [Tistlia consotensis]SMF80987.1 acyl carrier protein [Tistlia consotensis USBA 355]SNS22261.1 acyl carrier protein [Tistlia consotensis]
MSLTEQQIRTAVLEELGNVAPDAELDGLDPSEDLRDALDIDSMDHLNLMIALHKRLGIEIPERDYPKLLTVDAAVAYLLARAG